MPPNEPSKPKQREAGKGGQIIPKTYKSGKTVYIVKYASAHIGTAHSIEEAEQWIAREASRDPWREKVG